MSAELIRLADYGPPPVPERRDETSVEELKDRARLHEPEIQQLIIDSAESEYVPDAQGVINWVAGAIDHPDQFVWVAAENGVYCGLLLAEDLTQNAWSKPKLVYGYIADGASVTLRRRMGSVLPGWAEQRGLTEIWGYTHPDIPESYYQRIVETWGFDDSWALQPGVAMLRMVKGE